MKNIFLAISCLVLFACQNKKNTETNSLDSDSTNTATALYSSAKTQKSLFKDSLPYQTIHFYRETKRSSNPKDSNKYAYVKADYPKFADDQTFLNEQVLNIITAQPWTGNTSSTIEKATEKFFEDFLKFKKEAPESPTGYSWDENVTVSFQDKDLAVLTTESYIYTGGAHGMSSITYKNLDLKATKALKLDDLLTPNYRAKLTNIAESIFRKDEGLTEKEKLDGYFFENNTFSLNTNFSITPKGLLFTYNPYEIKPYAAGITHLLIPYPRIKELVKPNSFISKYVNK